LKQAGKKENKRSSNMDHEDNDTDKQVSTIEEVDLTDESKGDSDERNDRKYHTLQTEVNSDGNCEETIDKEPDSRGMNSTNIIDEQSQIFGQANRAGSKALATYRSIGSSPGHSNY
jgi:hypothetical protein